MGMKTGTGWREREAAGRAKLAERISPELHANLKIAEDRLQAERDAAAAFAAEQERKRLETLCRCPTCAGLGRTTVEDAATAIAGVEHYRQRALKPDARHYAKATASAAAAEIFAATAKADLGPASESVKAPSPRKPKTSAPPPPWLDHDAE